MSAALAVAQIPASCLQRTLEHSDALIEDLKTLRGQLRIAEPIALGLARRIETRILKVLDELSPEIRSSEARYQHYLAAARTGDAS